MVWYGIVGTIPYSVSMDIVPGVQAPGDGQYGVLYNTHGRTIAGSSLGTI